MAFKRAGVRIQLVYWRDPHESSGGDPALRDVCESVVGMSLLSNLQVVSSWGARMASAPLPALKRAPDSKHQPVLQQAVQSFRPNAIWLDGIWTGIAGIQLAEGLGVPMFTRSHNVEHLYMRYQRRLAPNGRAWIQTAMACVNLEAFEQKVLQRSRLFFDISDEDLRFWQSRGLGNGRWLPPLIDVRSGHGTTSGSDNRTTILFLGNLNTPNNVKGVEWLVSEVMPRVRHVLPEAMLIIAGSAPTSSIRALVTAASGVQLIENPPETAPLYAQARVLVNPAPWASGVNIKSIDMLATGLPVVSTTMGVKGLPSEIAEWFMVSDSPQGFAAAIVEASKGMSSTSVSHHELSEVFGMAAAERAIANIKEVL